MKTLLHTGGSLSLDDATADAVVRYSLALAQQWRMSAVSVADDATPSSVITLTVGFGVPLVVTGGGGEAAESSEDILGRLGELTGAVGAVPTSDIDPRATWEFENEY
ncbi:hypothetical protein C5C18_12860 [Rathayibacter tritici]|uniref:hypothetical protein n=1 Tax=Rathayibacter tritici TaxID=33888 RepID=UPI00083423B8|nr:hypothetical protein [Rathayibacter tritici]PPF27418.1 hypothetical protein C5C06_09690 [Rathayibacter tritici]PPF64764.1 hypothetical protein C5C21_11810 [Rathayibacter tritici]PPG05111.1 hypothetical protein C5C18_12860 [Rathayibacter tritici]PPI19263.1 hypothetical protein C5D07_02170 [Rathayibacter tritici]PPI48060.1 hypothetical protein C5D18_02115 [Rathayibacter tritici]